MILTHSYEISSQLQHKLYFEVLKKHLN